MVSHLVWGSQSRPGYLAREFGSLPILTTWVWDYKSMLPHQASYVTSEDQTWVIMLAQQALYWLNYLSRTRRPQSQKSRFIDGFWTRRATLILKGQVTSFSRGAGLGGVWFTGGFGGFSREMEDKAWQIITRVLAVGTTPAHLCKSLVWTSSACHCSEGICCIHCSKLYFPVILDTLASTHQNESTDGKNEKEKRNLLTSNLTN